jgi:hypothetical protein
MSDEETKTQEETEQKKEKRSFRKDKRKRTLTCNTTTILEF